MKLKKWITIIFCIFASLLHARETQDIQSLFGNPKCLELNLKMMRFVATHPKTTEYLMQGVQELVDVLEKYYTQTQKHIVKYPTARASTLAERRVTNIRYFLDNREVFTKAGLFLFTGIYDSNAYQDPKTWKQLIKTQDAILSHYIKRAQVKADFKTYQKAKTSGENPIADLELNLMKTIKSFCQKSTDPFFHTALYPLIQECQTREDILKHLTPLRDETLIDEESNELFLEAEEDYQTLNETTWLELKQTIQKHFRRKDTIEYLIEIFSDTFDIPNYP